VDPVVLAIGAVETLLDEPAIIMPIDALLDELCWFSCTALGALIIVESVIGAIAPAVTVTVTVHGAVDTTFWTGAINMHVDSGGGGAIFDDMDCAPARDTAARAVMV
jgi:hypothetical protein